MSEVKHNVWFEPVPHYLRTGPLVFVVTWRAPNENHDKIAAFCGEGINVQRLIPGKVAYSRTRTWFKPSDDGTTEDWWFMDEHDSAEAFEAMQQLVRQSFVGGAAAEGVAGRHQ
jgi:hypothetical protein